MIFVPFAWYDTFKDFFWHNSCLQRCSCMTDNYKKINGQCIEQKKVAENTVVIFQNIRKRLQLPTIVKSYILWKKKA